MRNRFLPVFATLAIVWLAACKHQDDFTIQGDLGHTGQIKKVYLLAVDSAGVQVVDSTNLLRTTLSSSAQYRLIQTYTNCVSAERYLT